MPDNTATAPPTLADMIRRTGRTGLRSYMGIIHEQELTQLQNVIVRMRIFREMRLDPTIGILEQAITRVLLAADFATIPAGNTPADQYAASLLLDIMHNMSVEWYEHVEDALEHLWFGFAITQIVLKQRPDGNIGVSDLMPMGQEMTFRWGRQDETGKVSGVEMLDPVTGTIYKLPSEKFLHFTDRGRKRNPEGEGMCLHVWRSWRYKTNLQELEAIGIERDVGGMPVAELPPNASEAEKADVVEQIKAMRQDENAGLVVPNGTNIQPYSASAKMYDIRKTIENYAWEILAYAGAQWLKLGEANGTQALVQGTTDMFGLYLRAIQERMLSVWHGQFVPTLAQFNPRLVTPNGTPKITWADPGVPDVKAILDAYSTATNAGILTPIRSDEIHVRSLLDLPELPDGVGIGDRGGSSGTDVLSAKIAELQFREQPMSFSKQTPEAELKELEDFAKSKGITVNYVGKNVLRDYDGMNWKAAAELDWDEPWPDKTIAINQASDTNTKLHTLRHELNESYLMGSKGMLYGPAHADSLTIESKPNQYIYDLMQADYAGWDEDKHPRASEGKENGGQFVPKGGEGGGTATKEKPPERPAGEDKKKETETITPKLLKDLDGLHRDGRLRYMREFRVKRYGKELAEELGNMNFQHRESTHTEGSALLRLSAALLNGKEEPQRLKTEMLKQAQAYNSRYKDIPDHTDITEEDIDNIISTANDKTRSADFMKAIASESELSQQYLKKRLNSDTVTLYRGVRGELANKFLEAKKKAKPDDTIEINNGILSGYTFDKGYCGMFGPVVVSITIPIKDVFYSFDYTEGQDPEGYGEHEVLVLGDKSNKFKASDIQEVKEYGNN